MPFDFRLMVRLFRRAFAENPPRARRRLLQILVVPLPLLAAVNTVCFALDRMLFPGFRKVEIRDPVFIIGHSRSGTSLLYRLMCADDETFSWFMTYELFFPLVVQHKLIRLLGRLDERWLGGSIDARRRAWEDRAFDRRLPEKQRRKIMQFYLECVRRQLYLNGSTRIHLSRNPLFSEKVRSLKEFFPDARFAICVRSPHETMRSIAKMMKRNWKASECSPEQISASLELLFESSVDFYLHPFEDLEGDPESRYRVVRYEDLIERPASAIREVYESLGIPLSASAEEQLRAAEKDARSYRPDHRDSLNEFGMTTEEIEARLAPVFDRFDWPRPEAS